MRVPFINPYPSPGTSPQFILAPLAERGGNTPLDSGQRRYANLDSLGGTYLGKPEKHSKIYRKCTFICVEGKEKKHLEKTSLSTPDRDSNPDLSVLGGLVYCESSALDHAATETELSQNLQQLSEKARSTTEFIQRLKGMADKVNENCSEFEVVVSSQCDALIQAIHERKRQLLDFIRQDKDVKLRTLKDQVSTCTCKLQHTTGLLQFCIEALKETDSAAFLQVGSMLINRVANIDITWHKDVVTSPRISHEFDLTLEDKSVLRSIEQLNFIQMKREWATNARLGGGAPCAPAVIPEECSAENNSVTIAWQPPPTSYVEGYVLELDDGNGGEFREVYCGKETICTVDGLHFNSMYNARVKAFNSTGEGEYSDLIGLQTAEVAWFSFDPCLAPTELQFSEDNCTVACEGYEHRVALGSVGFSRGVHYWEFSVNRYDSDTDPSFGIARLDVSKDQMLGKDDKGWSMYIDRQRSWFMHNSVHEQRSEGGIQPGSTVGVLLDLDRHQLSFYVNEEPQGPIAFQDLYGVFYPAVSLNRGVSVTLHTAIDPPSDRLDWLARYRHTVFSLLLTDSQQQSHGSESYYPFGFYAYVNGLMDEESLNNYGSNSVLVKIMLKFGLSYKVKMKNPLNYQQLNTSLTNWRFYTSVSTWLERKIEFNKKILTAKIRAVELINKAFESYH
uniref:E3 ubiquitin-protein ligase TRIM9 n=1 Tax=Timema douglasi TaxID=61478 RepID=A0A7R8VG82_TIMDO|nr:unnamed protein product [Timema douglasi]